MVIWNGDDVKGGSGWASCDQTPACKVETSLVEGEGIDGSSAMRVRAKGGGWIGGGWNWFGWWPENGGNDISQYDDFSLMIRVVAKEQKLLPEAGAVMVGLRCSNGKKSSPFAGIAQRAKGFTDGKWHKVTLPISSFRKGKEGKQFDLKSVWEIAFSTWADSPRDFDLYFDEISVEKR